MALLLLQESDDPAGAYAERDVFIRQMKLKNTLRAMRGKDLITHLGLDYYE